MKRIFPKMYINAFNYYVLFCTFYSGGVTVLLRSNAEAPQCEY